MRIFARLSLVALVAALMAGPVLAAPLARSAGPSLHTDASTPAAPSSGALLLLSVGVAVVGITIRSDTGTLAKKFTQRATAAAPDYKAGVQNAGGDWETNTKASEANYTQGVQQAIADGRFGKGVTGSASKYQANAVNLGSQRYGPGVQNAQDAWARGVQPALDTLKSLNLPPKGPRRSPQNMARANAVATALGALVTGK